MHKLLPFPFAPAAFWVIRDHERPLFVVVLHYIPAPPSDKRTGQGVVKESCPKIRGSVTVQ